MHHKSSTDLSVDAVRAKSSKVRPELRYPGPFTHCSRTPFPGLWQRWCC
ncbi:unnamed protein product [Protopolystoma xenopodis]|uniref:Uncharacterized protein n=1 Tax=Protopolystoma xenopodis TaxID=117903 RepID=A0A448X5X6_9PLAT|nr:unnamed protein product [Protopolystoma xenopodis]